MSGCAVILQLKKKKSQIWKDSDLIWQTEIKKPNKFIAFSLIIEFQLVRR